MPSLKYMQDIDIVIFTVKNRPERIRGAFKKYEEDVHLMRRFPYNIVTFLPFLN